jgi:hypothetical protein
LRADKVCVDHISRFFDAVVALRSNGFAEPVGDERHVVICMVVVDGDDSFGTRGTFTEYLETQPMVQTWVTVHIWQTLNGKLIENLRLLHIASQSLKLR